MISIKKILKTGGIIMLCGKCGKEIDKTWTLCPFCGEELKTEENIGIEAINEEAKVSETVPISQTVEQKEGGGRKIGKIIFFIVIGIIILNIWADSSDDSENTDSTSIEQQVTTANDMVEQDEDITEQTEKQEMVWTLIEGETSGIVNECSYSIDKFWVEDNEAYVTCTFTNKKNANRNYYTLFDHVISQNGVECDVNSVYNEDIYKEVLSGAQFTLTYSAVLDNLQDPVAVNVTEAYEKDKNSIMAVFANTDTAEDAGGQEREENFGEEAVLPTYVSDEEYKQKCETFTIDVINNYVGKDIKMEGDLIQSDDGRYLLNAGGGEYQMILNIEKEEDVSGYLDRERVTIYGLLWMDDDWNYEVNVVCIE